MSHLVTTPNISRADDIYQRLIELHAGLSEAESLRINARLIFILINHIGDVEVVGEAIDLARRAQARGAGERDLSA